MQNELRGTVLTIAIIVRNDSVGLKRLWLSLKPQIIDNSDLIDVLFVDNNSNDDTITYLQYLESKYPNIVKVVYRTRNHMGRARQQALELSKHDLTLFIDSDCSVPENWLENWKKQVHYFQDPLLCLIGGSNIPPNSAHPLYAALKVIFSNRFGTFKSTQVECTGSNRYVEHISTCHCLAHNKRIQACGGFSHHFENFAEDLELSLRLRSINKHLLFIPSNFIYHHYSPSLRSWIKRVFKYGRGQGLTTFYRPEIMLSKRIVPVILGLIGLNLLLFSPLILLFLLIIYIGLLILVSAFLVIESKQLNIAHTILTLLVATHFIYILGALWGLSDGLLSRLRRAKISPEKIPIE